jgi:hypothetical protein
MNTGLRLDWLSIYIEGDYRLYKLLDVNDNVIPGIKMYLHGRDFDKFKLYMQDDFNDSYPIALIKFENALLWGKKFNDIVEVINWISKKEGFRDYHITRCDLSVLIDYDFTEKGIKFLLDRVKGKVSKKNVKYYGCNDRVETVYIGNRRRCMLRIYDKLKELKDNDRKDYIFDEVKNWGKCFNVEYELKREWLKDFGIYRIGDLIGYLDNGELWKYLTKEYFYMADGCYIEDVWAEVQGVEFSMNGDMYDELVDVMVKEVKKDRLYSVIGGCLKRLYSVENEKELRRKITMMLEDCWGYNNEKTERRFKVRKVASEDR